jgi:peptidoglycan/LPS O-acetylase OafA/YrhL
LKKIPSLDGLRAVSISLVLLGHLIYSEHSPWRYLKSLAHYGVVAFFVISGFLITSLLLRENAVSGKISLRNFYVRRALRIFPLAYLFILCVFLLTMFHFMQVPWSSFATAATYVSNYNADIRWPFGHLWSLSVEEQFYLLWPSVLVLVGLAKSRKVVIATIILVPIIRGAVAALFPDSVNAVGGYFPLIADIIAIGCLAAFHQDELLKKLTRSNYQWAIPVLMFFSIYFPFHQPTVRVIFLAVNQTVFAFGFAYSMLWLIANSKSFVGRLLNSKPMVTIGVLSYSLYLWQELFVKQPNSTLAGVFLRLSAIFAVAIIGHYLVEKPFLKLKDRFAIKTAAAAA